MGMLKIKKKFKYTCEKQVNEEIKLQWNLYNEDLGSMKTTLLHVYEGKTNKQKQRNIMSWDQQNLFIRALYIQVQVHTLSFKIKTF